MKKSIAEDSTYQLHEVEEAIAEMKNLLVQATGLKLEKSTGYTSKVNV